MRSGAERLNQYQKSRTMPIEIEGIKFYTLAETAKALHVTAQTVRTYIKQGRLKGQRIGRPTLITETNLRDFLQIGSKDKNEKESN